MDTKNLSFKQVCWVQKLSRYHFQIDYGQDKAKRTANTLSCFFQRSIKEEKKLQVKNTQIFHRLQISLTKASLLGLSIGSKANLSPLYQVFICGTYVLSQLCQFWETFWTKLANKNLYKASIGGMRLRLAKLQELNEKVQRVRAAKELQDG